MKNTKSNKNVKTKKVSVSKKDDKVLSEKSTSRVCLLRKQSIQIINLILAMEQECLFM